MLRYLAVFGLGWFLGTDMGKKVAVNVGKNCVPLIEKELGLNIVKPLQELIKEPEHKEKKKND